MTVKKLIGWKWKIQTINGGNDSDILTMLDNLSSDKNVRDIRILAAMLYHEVFYQEKTYQEVTKTVQVE